MCNLSMHTLQQWSQVNWQKENTMSQYYLFIMFIFIMRCILSWTSGECISDFVAGVQMTTIASNSLYHSTLMTYPTTGCSVWTCCKDSSLERLDKSWSVPFFLLNHFFIIIFFYVLSLLNSKSIKKKTCNVWRTNMPGTHALLGLSLELKICEQSSVFHTMKKLSDNHSLFYWQLRASGVKCFAQEQN